MATSKDELLSLPTEAEYDAALAAQQAATHDVMRVKYTLGRITSCDPEEDAIKALPLEKPLTHEDIGRLYTWVGDARRNASELEGYLDDAAASLEELDFFRSVRSDG